MTQDLQQLIERARSEEPGPFRDLVFALQTDAIEVAVLMDLAQAGEPLLRRAAIEGARERVEPALLAVIAALAADPDASVREQLARALAQSPSWLANDVVARLLRDENDGVRLAAAEAAKSRPDLQDDLILRLPADDNWRVRLKIAEALGQCRPVPVLLHLLKALAEDADSDVSRASANSIEKLLTAAGGYPAELSRPPVLMLEEAHQRVASYGNERFPSLASWLAQRVACDVDAEQLRPFGTNLSIEAEAGRLPRAYGVEEACDAVLAALTGPPPRAVVLLGETGAGKSAVVYELTHRLRSDPDGPWHVLRISPSELLAGTVWLGEWQTKVRDLLKAIRYPKRVILYVPNLEELSEAGRSSSSDTNVATALAPHIERGEVVILGETTPEAFRKGLGAHAALRRLFHTVEVREATVPQTRAILQTVREESAADVPESVLDHLVELADYYLAGAVQPGRAVGLFRRVLGAIGGRPGAIDQRDVLATLSTSTGIPVDLLDDNIPLDRARVRAFFEARVMGQPEAVDAVVDLVTLVKAGLTDPGKPFGVLFFIGPTGVGKTELARTLAEMLFGDAGRLIRLDMSEFATHDAYERLIGWPTKPGTLTTSVRDRPFSVLLLDEIEKAHPNIFDLCLQIFDAGRLTDAQGRTADFRRTIIILTSNIGSAVAKEAPVGFGRAMPAPPDREATLRELSRWFRPEFLNRLDRIVLFRPLAAETAERIARREVARVLERSGIARRKLVVDVEPAVLPLLLREGYSPAFGARPLKRTVERLVLLPVARAIAAGHVTPGSVLRLVARSGRVDVEVAPPEAGDISVSPKEEAPPPASLAQRVQALVEDAGNLKQATAPLAERKSALVARSTQPGFWDNRPAAQQLYDEVYRLDAVLAAVEEHDKAVRGVADFVQRQRGSQRNLARIERQLEALEAQAKQVAFLVACRDARDLGDALLTLTLVASHGKGLDAVATLGKMYMNLARRRGLEVEVLDDRRGGDPAEDVITLLLTGAGAYALLTAEAGLHQLTRGKAEVRGAPADGKRGGRRYPERDVVRVEVFPAPAGDAASQLDEVRVEVQALRDVQGRLLAKPKHDVQLLHVPSMTAIRAWIDGSKQEAVERLRPLLLARVEAAKAAAPEEGRPPVVRRYNLGPTTLVRDLRTGRSTGRLDQVFEGRLDWFLTPPTG